MVAEYHGAGKTYPKISKPTPIYVNGRIIGQVVGDTFRKSIKSNHMLDKPPAIGFDRSTLQDAIAAGATRVEVYNRETGKTYTALIDTVYEYGFSISRGHGNQIHLPLDRWSINGATPVAERRAAQTNQAREDLQLSLFGEVQ